MAGSWRRGAIRKQDRKGKCVGESNPHWKGGRPVINGYRRVRVDGRYVREHRLVMEQHLGRALHPDEVVHHRNGDKLDNRIENLELIQSNSDHTREHYTEGTNRIERSRLVCCADCGVQFATMTTAYGEQRFCLKCRRRARNR